MASISLSLIKNQIRKEHVTDDFLDNREFPSAYTKKQEFRTHGGDYKLFPVFKWLEQNHQYFDKNQSQSVNYDKIEFISHGYLKQKDLICLKAIAGKCSNDMFLWFVDYLLRKDFQSRYENNRIGCLVEKYPGTWSVNEESTALEEEHNYSKRQRFGEKKYAVFVETKLSQLYSINSGRNEKFQPHFL